VFLCETQPIIIWGRPVLTVGDIEW